MGLITYPKLPFCVSTQLLSGVTPCGTLNRNIGWEVLDMNRRSVSRLVPWISVGGTSSQNTRAVAVLGNKHAIRYVAIDYRLWCGNCPYGKGKMCE